MGATFGATRRGRAKHLIVRGAVSLCGALDPGWDDEPGVMVRDEHGRTYRRDGSWRIDDRIDRLDVCANCALIAAELHAAATEG